VKIGPVLVILEREGCYEAPNIYVSPMFGAGNAQVLMRLPGTVQIRCSSWLGRLTTVYRTVLQQVPGSNHQTVRWPRIIARRVWMWIWMRTGRLPAYGAVEARALTVQHVVR